MDARLEQIENTTLSGYVRYKPADKRVDEKRGRRDGKRNRPASEAPHYPFRSTIITEAQAALRAYNHKVDDLISELDTRKNSLQQDLDERYAVQRDETNTNYQNELEHIEQKLGPNSAKHSSLRERLRNASDRERQLEAELGRPLRIHLKYWYAFIMAGVALIEIPINRFAFELYFAETPALSLLIALGVGFALMLLAHFGGTWLKRTTGKISRTSRALYIIGVIALAALIVPTIFLIALLRQHYVKFIEDQQITFSELLQQEGLESFAQDVITTNLGTQGWMLFMINMLVVGIGVLVAVVRHDSHPDYEKIVHTKEATERRLTKLKGKFEFASSKAKKEYENRLSSIEKQQERIEKDIESAATQRNRCVDHKDRMIDRVAVHIKQRLQAYESGNEDARNTDPPTAFWQADEQDIRGELEKAFEVSNGANGEESVHSHAAG